MSAINMWHRQLVFLSSESAGKVFSMNGKSVQAYPKVGCSVLHCLAT